MLKRESSVPDKIRDEESGYIKTVLYVILITALIATGIIAIASFTAGDRAASVGVTIAFIACAFLLWLTWRQRLALPRLLLPLLAFSAAVTLVRTGYGIRDEVMLIYPLTIVLAGLLRGKIALVVYALLCLGAITLQVYGEMTGSIVHEFSRYTSVQALIILGALVVLTAVLLYTTIDNLDRNLRRARRDESELAESNRELQAARATLEERVEERTRELARRTQYLEATAAIARGTASVLKLDELLGQVVAEIGERLGVYHAGVFMTDATGEWAELQAASSAGGQRMLARGHRLQVKGIGLVPYVISRGEPRIALEVGRDAMYFDNPDLPNTHSEIALPLRARGQIIGALDVQSDQALAFQQEDMVTLQALADQIALAISNARLFEQAQASLEAERRAYAQQSDAAWQALLQSNTQLGYLYQQGALVQLGNQTQARQTMEEQARNGHGDVQPSQPQELPELQVPVKARGSVVGTISAHKPGNTGEWTQEEIVLLETLSEQLGVALESARLYQDTQRRAAQERLMGQVTTRMRETLDIDTILRTAASEIRQTFELPEVSIQFVSQADGTTHGQGLE